MKKHFNTGLYALLMSGSFLAIAPPAYSQESEDQTSDADIEDSRLNTVIVTATRDSRSIDEVPMQVDVIGGDELSDFNILDVKDITILAPGLELTANDPRKQTATLRGISFDPDQGTSPAVEVYYNEVAIDAQVAFTSIYDIEQIEVLRGPQGLLRGQASPAGAITITTARPAFDKSEGYASVTGTDEDAYNFQAGLTMPLSENLALRVAGLVDGSRGNRVSNVTRGGETSKIRTESVRATLGWEPTDKFLSYLTYQYLQTETNQFRQVVGAGNTPFSVYSELFGTPTIFLPPAFGGGPFAVDTTVESGPAISVSDLQGVSDGISRNAADTHLINLDMEYDLGPATVGFIGAYQHSDAITERDLDIGNAIPGYDQFDSTFIPFRKWSGEVRIDSNNADGLGWNLGLSYFDQTGTVVNTTTADLFSYAVDPATFVQSPLGPGGSFVTVPNQLPIGVTTLLPISQETIGLSGGLSYVAGPWRVEGGLRYSIINRSQSAQISTVGFSTAEFEGIPENLQDIREKPLTGGVNIGYTVSPELNLYAAYANSFRAPTTGVAVPATISEDLIQTESERTNSFEIGMRGLTFDNRLRYSAAVFYQDFDGFINRFDNLYYEAPLNPAQPSGFFGFNFNGDATVQGVEGTFDGEITDNWDLGLQLSYAKARYDDASLPCNDFDGSGVSNQNGVPTVTGTGNVSFCSTDGRLGEVPDFTATMNTEVRFPQGSYTPYVSALVSLRPGFFSERAQFDYRDQTNINMYAGVRLDNGVSINLFAKNLLDQQRIREISLGNQVISPIIAGVFDSGYQVVNTTPGREFGITARYDF